MGADRPAIRLKPHVVGETPLPCDPIPCLKSVVDFLVLT